MKQTLGEKISPILEEVEITLLENQMRAKGPPGFPASALRSSVLIFIDIFMENMWKRQKQLDMPIKQREDEAIAAGKELRDLILKYTNIDSREFYK